jgi:hypothetical protein
VLEASTLQTVTTMRTTGLAIPRGESDNDDEDHDDNYGVDGFVLSDEETIFL